MFLKKKKKKSGVYLQDTQKQTLTCDLRIIFVLRGIEPSIF